MTALVISYDGESHRIWKQDIYYIEATGHYVEIHTARRIIRVRSKLDAFESELKSPQFCRCHRAFLCNLYYAETINKDTILDRWHEAASQQKQTARSQRVYDCILYSKAVRKRN